MVSVRQLLFALVLSLQIPLLAAGKSLPPGGTPILAPDWSSCIPKSTESVKFSIHNGKYKKYGKILHVVAKNNITFRKPDNYPLTLKLSQQEFTPGSTVAVRFLYYGKPLDPHTEAFREAPMMSFQASYRGKSLVNSRSIGRMELFPFWRDFSTSFSIPNIPAAKKQKRRRRNQPNNGLTLTLFFGHRPQNMMITGLDVRCYPPGKLPADSLVAPSADGNSLIVFQNHSKTIDVLWNDAHPLKRPLHVCAVRQPKFGQVSFSRKTVTYKSTKPHEMGYDYFYYTVEDDKGNRCTAPVKVIVTPDFTDGTWNIGHDYKNFPNELSTDKGNPVFMRRFVSPWSMSVSAARVIKTLEKLENEGKLKCPLKYTLFPFAKRGPNGENQEPCGIYWDLPHCIDSTFCVPIMHEMGCVVNQTFSQPHTHYLKSFRMKFDVKQRCINTDDRKVRFFFKTTDGVGDIGLGYAEFKPDPKLIYTDQSSNGASIVKIGSQLYRTSTAAASITCKDSDGDGFPDQWFTKDGKPMKGRNNGARALAPVKDMENISVDFDMKDYFDWAECHGWKGGGHISYLMNGSEMGSAMASHGRMKGAGIMTFDNVEYWLSTDIPAKHPIPDINLSNSGKLLIIDMKDVFNRIYAANLDGSIPKLEYKTIRISDKTLLKTVIRGSKLVLVPHKGATGKTQITIKVTDKTWHWDDIETFNVTLTNATKIDSDHDGISDLYETYKYRTNPIFADTDFDGINDGDEILKYKLNPLVPDMDGDGLTDGKELANKTDPHRKDSDGDGLTDGDEVLKYKSNPLKKDSDGDRYSDAFEAIHGMDPNQPYSIFARYDFNESKNLVITDKSGHNNNLTMHRRTRLVPGKHGKALNCDGSHITSFKADKTSQTVMEGYTISFWVNPGKNSKQGACFNAPNFAITTDSKNFIYTGNPPAGTKARWSGRGPRTIPPKKIQRIIAPCHPGEWTHITVVSDGKNSTILINGVPKTILKNITNGGFSHFELGGSQNRRAPKWIGLIDDLMIAPRPFSKSEINRLVHQTAP